MTRRLALAALALALLAGCAFRVDGRFIRRDLAPDGDHRATILVIYNHGFSGQAGGPDRVPAVIELAATRNSDVVVFNQVRKAVAVSAADMSLYVEAAIEHFRKTYRIPVENMILAGQSCGGWGALQAAAYPTVGGVLALAPTCHGRLSHSDQLRWRRAREISALAGRIRAPGAIFLYEGDAYYDLGEWKDVDREIAARAPGMRLQRLTREQVLAVCPRCTTDSHGAAWSAGFARAYFETHVQPLIDQVREAIRARSP